MGCTMRTATRLLLYGFVLTSLGAQPIIASPKVDEVDTKTEFMKDHAEAFDNEIEATIDLSTGTSLWKLQSTTSELNAIVDFFLIIARRKILSLGDDKAKLPPIEHKFALGGKFIAEDGWFEDLASLYRTDNSIATLMPRNVSLTLQTAFGLQHTYFKYSYSATLGPVKTSGTISGTVHENSISAKVTVQLIDKKCVPKVDDIHVVKFSGIKVSIDGLGLLKPFEGLICEEIIKTVKANLGSLEKKLKLLIESQLPSMDC